MLRDAVRGVVAVAATIAEETGKRVLTTATGLLERGGVDVAAVERRIAEQFPPSGRSLQSLAEEAVTVGRAGVDMAVGVARAEAERVFERVGDQVVKIGVVLSFLESQLRSSDEEEEPAADSRADQPPTRPAPRAEGLFEAGWDDEEWGSRAEADAEEVPADAWAVPEDEPAPGEPSAGAGTAPREQAPAKRAAARKAPAKKAPGEKAPGKKAPAAKRTAKAPTPKDAMPKKAGAKKAAAAKKTVAKKTVARKTVVAGAEAPKPAAARKTATRKTVVRKTTVARPESERGTDD
ncbi:hypothetical protein [Kitasatospora sp. NPDC088346]|uniref:hypothetical protein n=1 Tax=Kitasatospora sp. NPDC088346 TaxID=3364073 RepID=UPI0038194A28